ncbi:MAG: RNA polymerase sigma-70 factor [Tannerella sp.]|jgi:RNA polymerase sigma-70 factor (ECF subfamily)|nr:RNA polymerase sigma-70 factor [Tannerella sp.]
MLDTEANFIERLRNGEDSAYRMLFDRYYNIMYAVAYKYVADNYQARMLVSDVVFRIWEQREALDIRSSLRDYLVVSVKNMSINYLNMEKRLHRLDDYLETVEGSTLADDDTPLEVVEFEELQSKLTGAVSSLPPECREVFRLSRMEELPHTKIAARLNISVNTVRYHIKNALSKLRKELRDYI